MASRNYGLKEIYSWKCDRLELPEEWANHLGRMPHNFRMLIAGESGHGKTEYIIKLAKMLATYLGKVHYNSTEQGKSADFQDAVIRNNMDELDAGKFMLADANQRTFAGWFNKVQKPNSGRVLLLDSMDYMHLSFIQYQQIHERFKRQKAIIINSWGDPMAGDAKRIRYTSDYKVKVKDYKAYIRSRHGGNEPFVIRDKKTKGSKERVRK